VRFPMEIPKAKFGIDPQDLLAKFSGGGIPGL
jgi:hypothetical protein